MIELIAPHGGTLQQLYLGPEQAEREKARAVEFSSWDLTQRQLCDIKLLLNGVVSAKILHRGSARAVRVEVDHAGKDGAAQIEASIIGYLIGRAVDVADRVAARQRCQALADKRGGQAYVAIGLIDIRPGAGQAAQQRLVLDVQADGFQHLQRRFVDPFDLAAREGLDDLHESLPLQGPDASQRFPRAARSGQGNGL